MSTAGGRLAWLRHHRAWGRLADPKDVQMQWLVAAGLLAWETLFTALVVRKVPYTEIDWVAYMEEVGGYQDGERDYTKLRGGTGPLVYPAGFVHLFDALQRLTSGHIGTAQVIFALLYVATQALVMRLYIRSGVMPPWTLALLCLSKRLHSIFVLRLFNDCWAMMLAYLAANFLIERRSAVAIALFSLAVSVKMNVLLFAPGVLAVCLAGATLLDTAFGVAAGVLAHVAMALPFLLHSPSAYISRAFEFSRVFMYKWTVNWRLLPEHIFLHPAFAKILLATHLLLLGAFAHCRWLRSRGGVAAATHKFLTSQRRVAMSRAAALSVVLCSNLLGVVTARSLHYQFYSWYFHAMPFLLWQTRLSVKSRLALLLVIEACWNTYPSTTASSGALLMCHVALVVSLWRV